MRKIFGIVLCLSVALFSATSLSSCGGDDEDDVEKATDGGGKSEAGDSEGKDGDGESGAGKGEDGDDSGKGNDGSGDKQYTHAVVDLGLPSGLLWATCNVGASKPYEHGDYFAWGETVPKSYYDWDTYKWCKGSHSALTKYCYDSPLGYNGFTDGKTVLDAEDDAATVNWGAGYRMPTYAEFDELCVNCTWTWDSSHTGYIVTGTNGNSIFLRASGYRYWSGLDYGGSLGGYWSATLDSGLADTACYLSCNSGSHNPYGNSFRYYGRTVRPVADK